MAEGILFSKDDVYAIDVPLQGCSDCTDGDETSQPKGTQAIMLDFRGAGETVQFGNGLYCPQCATQIIDRIRETLPESTNDN